MPSLSMSLDRSRKFIRVYRGEDMVIRRCCDFMVQIKVSMIGSKFVGLDPVSDNTVS
jgi:hypothetical protein